MNKKLSVPVRPAATVVLLRQQQNLTEVLMLYRNPALVFAGDCWVFPGGRIDEADALDCHNDNEDQIARTAAVRETREETGLFISAETLIAISHWTTPENSPKRYSTAFYVAELENHAEVVVDGSEIFSYQWVRAEQALQEHTDGIKKMLPPTVFTLEELCHHDSPTSFIDMCRNRKPHRHR